MPPLSRTLTIEAALHRPYLAAQMVRMQLDDQVNDFHSAGPALRMDLCLTPRPAGAEARFANHWAPGRFEAVGQVFVIPPGEILQFRAPGGRQVALMCALQPALFAPWLGEFTWTERRLEASLDIGAPRIIALLRFLAQELQHPALGQEVAADLIAQHLCIELARYLLAVDEPATTGGLASWRLKLIEERLAEQGPAPTLMELAALCNLSIRQLTRGFRTSRGYSIGEYVTQHRMDMARRLLGGDERIKDIARRMGFASAAGFSFAFRQATGVTPKLFRTRVLRGI